MNRAERTVLDAPWPEPASYPGVVKARGGWFGVEQPRQLGTGPWRTEEAAQAALQGDYDKARLLDRPQA